MDHSFSVEIACSIGQNAAIIFQHLNFWVAKNEANNQNYHDGAYWTYNSIKAFKRLFPYMSAKQIRGALDKLEAEGLIAVAEYNEKPFDHTQWYSITEKGKSIMPKGQIDVPEKANRLCQKGNAIPDNKPDIYNTPYNPPQKKAENDDLQDVICQFNFSEQVQTAAEDWIAYKQERKEAYRPRGLKSLLTKVSSSVQKHGESAVVEIIADSMANGYQGIVWDKLDRRPNTQQRTAAQAMPQREAERW